MTVAMMKLKDIIVDEDLQVRLQLDFVVVGEYADSMRRGDEFPPLEIYQVDGKNLLVDGFHRIEAFRLNKFEMVAVNINTGDYKAAVMAAIMANRHNALHLKNVDRQRAVTMAFINFPELSDREIARRIGVSNPMVSKYRKVWNEHLASLNEEERKGVSESFLEKVRRKERCAGKDEEDEEDEEDGQDDSELYKKVMLYLAKEDENNKELAKILGTSQRNVEKIKAIQDEGDEELIDGIRKGTLTINKAYNMVYPDENDNDDPDIEDMEFEEIQQLEESIGYNFGQNLVLDTNPAPYVKKLVELKEQMKELEKDIVDPDVKVGGEYENCANKWKMDSLHYRERTNLNSQIYAIEKMLNYGINEANLNFWYYYMHPPHFGKEKRDVEWYVWFEEDDKLRTDFWNKLGLPLQPPYRKVWDKRLLAGLAIVGRSDGKRMEKLKQYEAWKGGKDSIKRLRGYETLDAVEKVPSIDVEYKDGREEWLAAHVERDKECRKVLERYYQEVNQA